MRLQLTLAYVVAVFVSGHDARGQTVPLLTGELTVGRGPASKHAGGQWYPWPPAPILRAGLAVRLGSAGVLRPVILLETSFDTRGDAVTGGCYSSPAGGCRGDFPRMTGHSIGIGVRRALGRRGMLGVGAGAGAYERPVHFTEIDASWRVLSRLAVMSDLRYVYFSVGGHRVWSRPLAFGARIVW